MGCSIHLLNYFSKTVILRFSWHRQYRLITAVFVSGDKLSSASLLPAINHSYVAIFFTVQNSYKFQIPNCSKFLKFYIPTSKLLMVQNSKWSKKENNVEFWRQISLLICEKKGSDRAKMFTSRCLLYIKMRSSPTPDPDLDPALDPALFISSLKDANKNNLFCFLLLNDTFTS